MFARWKQLWDKESKSKDQKLKPIHYLIILLGIGIACMILTDFLRVEPDRPLGLQMSVATDSPPANQDNAVPAASGSMGKDEIAEYEHRYETQLAEILETVIGVGKVEVMVNLDSTPEIVIEKNREARSSTTQETDKDKATRNQSDQSHNEQVLVVRGPKQDQPVIIKTLKPKVRGVLVVAKGAENMQVKVWITEAVQKVLDVPAYKISILPKKG